MVAIVISGRKYAFEDEEDLIEYLEECADEVEDTDESDGVLVEDDEDE